MCLSELREGINFVDVLIVYCSNVHFVGIVLCTAN